MHRTIFTASFLGLLGAGLALADEASTNATAGRISLFQVPFDALSKIEARTIAQRMVHRVQASVTLTPEKTAVLEDGIASAFEHRFIDSPNSTGSKREQLFEDISTVARANLDQKEIAALEAAFAKGIKPLPEDNESAKSKSTTPECCRFPSQS